MSKKLMKFSRSIMKMISSNVPLQENNFEKD